MYRVSRFVTQFAFFLLAGVAIALVWSNIAPQSYSDFVELRLGDSLWLGYPNPDSPVPMGRTLTVEYLSGNVLMALFFFYVGKEIWEALVLRQGSMRGLKAVVPLGAALGALAVPALVYIALARVTGGALPDGWIVPMASDVALCYVVGRHVLGTSHPALRFLLLVVIADDLAAILIAGVAFPAGALHPGWLGLSFGAALAAFGLFNWLPRRLDRGNQLRPASSFVRRRLSVWPYVVAGAASWYGFQQAGLIPALGLLPIVPTVPHADRAFGLFAEAEEILTDTLNRIAHFLVRPVSAILFLFGLTHGGAGVDGTSGLTYTVLAAMVVGKPLGVTLGALGAARLFRLRLPQGIARRDLPVVGLIAAIGLTVPIMTAKAGLPGGSLQGDARLGLILGSLLALLLLEMIRRRARTHGLT